MCMENVKPWPDDVEKPRVGYKVFRAPPFMHEKRECIFIPCFGEDTQYEVGEWYMATYCPHYRRPINYREGFHVFFTKEDAKHYKEVVQTQTFARLFILQVEVKDHQHIGDTVHNKSSSVELRWRTFTAKSMRIPESEIPAPVTS